MMQNLTATVTQYVCMSAIILLSLFSIILKDRRKKLFFLFFIFIFSGILGFLLFSGMLIFLMTIVIFGFFGFLYLFIYSAEIYNKEEKLHNNINKKSRLLKILNIVIPLAFCGAIAYLFYFYTFNYSGFYSEIKEITPVRFISIVGELISNYSMAILIFISSLFISVIWLILILDTIKIKEKK